LQFTVTYSLEGKKLITGYEIFNRDSQSAYFSVGAHPAFACPFDAQHKITDYAIEFEQGERLLQHEITSAAFFTGKSNSLALGSMNLDENTFDNDALVFTGYQSEIVSLVEVGSKRRINVSVSGFPWLGLWSKPKSKVPYVCIEPWCGHSDMLGFVGELSEKAAIEQVAAGASWQREYFIEFDY
jgi:galactose mutarotase-like enzyme